MSNGLVTHVFFFRRVHITQATLDYLGGEYEVEPGNGATRNQYLRDHCVTTYFIVPPARRRKVLVTSQNDRRGCILLHPNDRIVSFADRSGMARDIDNRFGLSV